MTITTLLPSHVLVFWSSICVKFVALQQCDTLPHDSESTQPSAGSLNTFSFKWQKGRSQSTFWRLQHTHMHYTRVCVVWT